MPIYEYRCEKCGERFEIMCGHAARDDLTVCPACGARQAAPVYRGFKVGISRTRLNPGTFERTSGERPRYEPPPKG